MAEGARPLQPEGRTSAAGRVSRQKSPGSRVSLEKVLGITAGGSSALTSDPNSGLIAYPAGCVVVLLQPLKNKQSHIINTCRKPFTALAFSLDGKHLVTGESGHMPCVRVWKVGGSQLAKVQAHKYGVSCVAFSPNSSYVVSVGYQHDMTVCVWDWRKGQIIASNKVSSRVWALSFSQDSSYFVTAGNRHVKFWYLDASRERWVNSTVPLIGRSGLLGNHKNCVYSAVACGRGPMASSTFCITSSSLLCLFNSSRQLEAWVDLKMASASCMAVSEDLVFCGGAAGEVQVFLPRRLQFVTRLPPPHRLGLDLLQASQPSSPGARRPDAVALTFDPVARHLTCLYSDHSVYVWDVRDVMKPVKVFSALYHSSCVWSLEVYPELSDPSQARLPASAFLTCSSDNTIRLWSTDAPWNPDSEDLLKIMYLGEDTQHPQAADGDAATTDGKAGVRVLAVSPDGQLLAAGDRCGNLRIFGLEFLDEVAKIEAHDSEVLCLEFSPPSAGVKLLASGSRDRLIHIFNLERNFSVDQTFNDHSASVTAVRFTGERPEVRMVSCGADRSLYLQKAEQLEAGGAAFCRSHQVVEKMMLYDMDLDSSRTHVAVACQDRNVRIYNVETGKLERCLKGSSSDGGALVKVHLDPSGSFLATSCSDKKISILDYESGECVATLLGHSEIVTSMRFSQDCRHLITVAGDSCVFVWRLDAQMIRTMRRRRAEQRPPPPPPCADRPIRRETFITGTACKLLQEQQEEHPEELEEHQEVQMPAGQDAEDVRLPPSARKRPLGFREPVVGPSSADGAGAEVQGRRRWDKRPRQMIICYHHSPCLTKEEEEEDFKWEFMVPTKQDADGPCGLLQPTGKTPVWLRRLEGRASADTPGPQTQKVRDQGAEPLTPLVICSYPSPSPMEVRAPAGQDAEGGRPGEEDGQGRRRRAEQLTPLVCSQCSTRPEEDEEEAEEDEDFHPLCLETLLGHGEDEETAPPAGLQRNHLLLRDAAGNREFRVQPTGQRPKVRGQGAELSPDSACSEGSTGSLEAPDAGGEAELVSSAGSSGLEEEEEEDATSLPSHFATLSCHRADEKFTTDPRSLRPPEEKHFLNPRLSISTRFLSRFQNRLRCGRTRPPASCSGPGQAPPPAAVQQESRLNEVSVSWRWRGEETAARENADGLR